MSTIIPMRHPIDEPPACISVRVAFHDLGISYDRTIALPLLWPGLTAARLEDPDRLMRRSVSEAIGVAKANIIILDHLISVERRRALSPASAYSIASHAAALSARRAESLILTFAERSAAFQLPASGHC